MNVLRHQHIPSHSESVLQPRLFKLHLEHFVSSPTLKERKTVETAEGEEMKTTGVLNPNESFWHGRISLVPEQKSCYPTLAMQGWGTQISVNAKPPGMPQFGIGQRVGGPGPALPTQHKGCVPQVPFWAPGKARAAIVLLQQQTRASIHLYGWP
jgi:hypothetical protein